MNNKTSSKKRFSISDYLWAKCFGKGMGGRGEFEMETNTRLVGDDYSDLISPFSMRSLNVGTESAGGNTVGTKNVSPSFQNLYSDSFFLNNSTVLENLTSDITLDSKNVSGILTSTAQTENQSNVYSTEPSWSDIQLTPHWIRVSIDLSEDLIFQSSKGIDDLIVEEFRNSLISEFERQVMRGGTATNEITGIASATGISTSNWGALTALSGAIANENIVEAESNLSSAKIPKPYHILINAETRAALRQIRKPGFSYPICTDDGKVLGYDVEMTENLEDATLYFVSPQMVICGLWHDRNLLDLFVNIFSKSNQGLITLTLGIIADCAIAKPKALSIILE